MSEATFDKVIETLKNYTGIRSDAGIAQELQMNPIAFSQRKMRSSIPYKEIVEYCVARNVSIDSIFNDSLKNNDSVQKIKKQNQKDSLYFQEYNHLLDYVQNGESNGASFVNIDALGFGRSIVLFKINEDGMAPTLSEGEIAVLDLKVGNKNKNGIFLIMHNEQLLIRRFVYSFSDTLIIKSDNDNTEQFEISLEKAKDIKIIGEIVAKLTVKKL